MNSGYFICYTVENSNGLGPGSQHELDDWGNKLAISSRVAVVKEIRIEWVWMMNDDQRGSVTVVCRLK